MVTRVNCSNPDSHLSFFPRKCPLIKNCLKIIFLILKLKMLSQALKCPSLVAVAAPTLEPVWRKGRDKKRTGPFPPQSDCRLKLYNKRITNVSTNSTTFHL